MSILYYIKDLKNILNNIFFRMIVNFKQIIWRSNNKSFFAANQARQNTASAYGHAQAHDQLKVARVFTSAAHALAHLSSALARLRRVHIFVKLFRMPKVTFEYILSKIEGHIKKEDTFYTFYNFNRKTGCSYV